MINGNARALPERERFLLKEWKVVVLYRPRPRLHHLLSSPRSFLYLTPPHNQPLGLLSFLSAVHLSFFLFTLPVTSHPSPSPSPLLSSSLPPSVSLSLTSLMSEDGGSHGCTELPTPSAHDFGVCAVFSCVSAVPRPRPRPALFHKHLGDSVIFSALFTSSRPDVSGRCWESVSRRSETSLNAEKRDIPRHKNPQ